VISGGSHSALALAGKEKDLTAKPAKSAKKMENEDIGIKIIGAVLRKR
jgi:hypothetical protein